MAMNLLFWRKHTLRQEGEKKEKQEGLHGDLYRQEKIFYKLFVFIGLLKKGLIDLLSFRKDDRYFSSPNRAPLLTFASFFRKTIKLIKINQIFSIFFEKDRHAP